MQFGSQLLIYYVVMLFSYRPTSKWQDTARPRPKDPLCIQAIIPQASRQTIPLTPQLQLMQMPLFQICMTYYLLTVCLSMRSRRNSRHQIQRQIPPHSQRPTRHRRRPRSPPRRRPRSPHRLLVTLHSHYLHLAQRHPSVTVPATRQTDNFAASKYHLGYLFW